jgi:preprotein translocase subunit YajC
MLWDVNVHGLVLAQSVPAPGEGVPADPSGAPSTGAPGTTGGAGGTPNLLLPLLALMIVFMLVFSIFGQRRERKKREQLISSVRKHDKVQTIGGVIGSVVEVTDAEVLLKVDESSNTRIRFARSAVQQVLESGRGAGGEKAASA